VGRKRLERRTKAETAGYDGIDIETAKGSLWLSKLPRPWRACRLVDGSSGVFADSSAGGQSTGRGQSVTIAAAKYYDAGFGCPLRDLWLLTTWIVIWKCCAAPMAWTLGMLLD
jgi:hypothetical protein